MEDSVIRIFRSTIVAALLVAASSLVQVHATEDKAWAIDKMLGKPDAPITIIEYASLTCPHCAAFHSEVFPKVKAEWIDTGKARFIFRDFPWDPGAQAAALISQCSGDRYFAFIDTYFHTQAQWAHSESPVAALRGIARFGGLSNDEVDKCMSDKTLFQQIADRQKDGEDRYGVNSTPSFIINGKLYAGEMSYESFAKILSKLP
jgi:protein-disulfide isomerase